MVENFRVLSKEGVIMFVYAVAVCDTFDAGSKAIFVIMLVLQLIASIWLHCLWISFN